MLVIRPMQMDAFEQAALRAFENEMVVYCFEFSPRHCKVIGEDNVRDVIRLGITNAHGYGLTNRGPLRSYIEMMFTFGSGFDTDPQLPWAAEILKSEEFPDQMDKADRLFQKSLDYLEEIAGPNNVYTIKALRDISVLARQPLPVPSEAIFVDAMIHEMRNVYPQKCVYVGETALRVLIQEAIKVASDYQFSTLREQALCAVLMFALGHRFADDPLLPWISSTLTDPKITDPVARARRLEAKVLTYLEHVLMHLGQQ